MAPCGRSFVARLTKRRPERGVSHSVVDLPAATNRVVDEHNAPKPFKWTADPNKIVTLQKKFHGTENNLSTRKPVIGYAGQLRVGEVAKEPLVHWTTGQLSSAYRQAPVPPDVGAGRNHNDSQAVFY